MKIEKYIWLEAVLIGEVVWIARHVLNRSHPQSVLGLKNRKRLTTFERTADCKLIGIAARFTPSFRPGAAVSTARLMLLGQVVAPTSWHSRT